MDIEELRTKTNKGIIDYEMNRKVYVKECFEKNIELLEFMIETATSRGIDCVYFFGPEISSQYFDTLFWAEQESLIDAIVRYFEDRKFLVVIKTDELGDKRVYISWNKDMTYKKLKKMDLKNNHKQKLLRKDVEKLWNEKVKTA